jgi:DNA repair protein RadA/Sms
MARDGATYVCQSCGTAHAKWAGQCSGCQAWNTLVEEVTSRPPGALAPTRATKQRGLSFESLQSENPTPPRIATGVDEFDRVCGGGVVPGSAILLAGDPGVGKSTLLLQVAASAALRGVSCAYVSGEEAVEQIRARAHRMGFAAAPVKLAAETTCGPSSTAQARARRAGGDRFRPDHVERRRESGAGSDAKVRAAAGELVRPRKDAQHRVDHWSAT